MMRLIICFCDECCEWRYYATEAIAGIIIVT